MCCAAPRWGPWLPAPTTWGASTRCYRGFIPHIRRHPGRTSFATTRLLSGPSSLSWSADTGRWSGGRCPRASLSFRALPASSARRWWTPWLICTQSITSRWASPTWEDPKDSSSARWPAGTSAGRRPGPTTCRRWRALIRGWPLTCRQVATTAWCTTTSNSTTACSLPMTRATSRLSLIGIWRRWVTLSATWGDCLPTGWSHPTPKASRASHPCRRVWMVSLHGASWWRGTPGAVVETSPKSISITLWVCTAWL